MYAIVEIAGHQFKVQKNQRVYVHRLEASEGSNLEFDKVLLIDNDGKIVVGTPTVDGYRVAAQVLSHLQGDKVIVFKKKRRKGYAKKNGHRQQLSEILVQDILGKGETLKAADSKAVASKRLKTPPVAKAKKTAAPVVAEVETKAPVKKARKKKAE
ncbi:MAG TPA: 50S ribosomal protein L21 [Bacteroidia bacterium]|jgi:large subunit ribosomal protein L21|nr:50S ribosomal protein L21 [Bacteroidia bacterium]